MGSPLFCPGKTWFAAYRSIALIVTRPFVKTRVCQGFFLHSIWVPPLFYPGKTWLPPRHTLIRAPFFLFIFCFFCFFYFYFFISPPSRSRKSSSNQKKHRIFMMRISQQMEDIDQRLLSALIPAGASRLSLTYARVRNTKACETFS